jgi:hypothetical protein
MPAKVGILNGYNNALQTEAAKVVEMKGQPENQR